MKIREFLDETGLSQRFLADQVGATRMQMHCYAKGKRVPLHIALRIEEFTGGKVSCRDMVEDELNDHKPMIKIDWSKS